MKAQHSDNSMIMNLNLLAVIVAYVLLSLSLYLSTEVPLATKGYWGMAVLMLTVCLVNFVKYRFDARAHDDRIRLLEDAKNERLLAEFVTDSNKG